MSGDACTDERIDPIDEEPDDAIAQFPRYGDTESGINHDGGRQLSRVIYVLVPIACACEKVESCGTSGTFAALGRIS